MIKHTLDKSMLNKWMVAHCHPGREEVTRNNLYRKARVVSLQTGQVVRVQTTRTIMRGIVLYRFYKGEK